jgi:hypothetical protein
MLHFVTCSSLSNMMPSSERMTQITQLWHGWLDTLIPSSNVVTLNASALTYEAVVEAARIVRTAGGIPRELYASSIDIENVVRELARTYGIGPEGQAKWLTGELPFPLHTGTSSRLCILLFPATGNRKALFLTLILRLMMVRQFTCVISVMKCQFGSIFPVLISLSHKDSCGSSHWQFQGDTGKPKFQSFLLLVNELTGCN